MAAQKCPPPHPRGEVEEKSSKQRSGQNVSCLNEQKHEP